MGFWATAGAIVVKSGLVVGILLMRLMCVMVIWVLRRLKLVNKVAVQVHDVEKGACEHFEERFAGQK